MRVPGERFASRADHAAWHAGHAAILFDRATVEASWPHHGTCAPCRRAARFDDGQCDCLDRLDEAARLLLHASVAEAGLCGWSRLHLAGLHGAVAERIAALAGTLVAAGAAADLAILGPQPDDAGAALSAARRGAVPGGCLLAPVGSGGAVSHAGWAALDAARAAGFARAEMLRPWSRELGYRGGSYLLKAVA